MIIRTRFAPSPTGELHLGGLRTALYNYLFAKKGGPGSQFLIRIEDTDQDRLVPGATERLMRALHRTGIEPMTMKSASSSSSLLSSSLDLKSTSSTVSDAAAPDVWIQSERLAVYRAHAGQLLQSGHAYRCFCSRLRLRRLSGLGGGYDRFCLHLNEKAVRRNLDERVPFVVRLKVPAAGTLTVHDAVRGTVPFDCRHLQDPVILKSDGFPTYHLANVVDDRCQEITHVIRGEEWLSSAPKHVLLYEAFGWRPPTFAHLPLLLNADGTKFSKRSADAHDMTVDAVLDRVGVEPLALVNFVARLGCTLDRRSGSCTDGAEASAIATRPTGADACSSSAEDANTTVDSEEDDSVYSMDELADRFSLSRVHKSGAAVSQKKLLFFNRIWLQQQPRGRLAAQVKCLVVARLREKGVAQSWQSPNPAFGTLDQFLVGLVTVFRDHMKTVRELVNDSQFLFFRPEAGTLADDDDTTKQCLRRVATALSETETAAATAAADEISGLVKQEAKQSGLKQGQVLKAFRRALTGSSSGPPVFETAALLGAHECSARLTLALTRP